MKIITLLLFMTSIAYSQSFRTDIGGGTLEKLKNPMIILDMMEKNKPIDIKRFFLNPKELNKKEWNTYKSKIYSSFPNNDNSYPATDIKKSDHLWYERTYYSRGNKSNKYHLQVYFELIEINDSVKIKRIEFREGNSITNRDKHLKRLEDRSIPPPPPAFITE
ncbi:MAG: hypothetical protein ABJK28_18375 [Algibacter sp.]